MQPDALRALAAELGAATDPAAVEALGWRAAALLLNLEGRPDGASRAEVSDALGGNPAVSLDACRALHESVLPALGWKIEGPDPCQRVGSQGWAAVWADDDHCAECGQGNAPAVAWLVALLRAVAARREAEDA